MPNEEILGFDIKIGGLSLLEAMNRGLSKMEDNATKVDKITKEYNKNGKLSNIVVKGQTDTNKTFVASVRQINKQYQIVQKSLKVVTDLKKRELEATKKLNLEAKRATEERKRATSAVKAMERAEKAATTAKMKLAAEIRREANELRKNERHTAALAMAKARLSAQTNKANANVTRIKNSFKSQTTAVETLKLSIVQLERVMTFFLIRRALFALLGAMRQAIELSVKFDKSIVEIRTIAQDAQGSFGQWAESIKSVSDAFDIDLIDAANARYEILSNQITKGVVATEMFEAAAGRFAKVAKSSLSDSVNLLTGAMNAYGIQAEDVDRVSAILFRTIEFGRVRAADMANTFGKVAIVAAQMGVSLEDLGAMIATITVQGVKANESMTLIRGIFMKLAKPTEELTSLFNKLGVANAEQLMQVYGLADAFKILFEETKGTNTEIAKLFGRIRPTMGISALINQLEKFTEVQAKFGSSADVAFLKAWQDQFKTSGEKMSQAMTQIRNDFALTFGKNLTAMLIWSTSVFDKVVVAIDGTKSKTHGLTRVVTGLTKVMIAGLGSYAAIKALVLFNAKMIATKAKIVAIKMDLYLMQLQAVTATTKLRAYATAAVASFGTLALVAGVTAASLVIGNYIVKMKQAKDALDDWVKTEQQSRMIESTTGSLSAMAQALTAFDKAVKATALLMATEIGKREKELLYLEDWVERAEDNLKLMVTNVSDALDRSYDALSQYLSAVDRQLADTKMNLETIRRESEAFFEGTLGLQQLIDRQFTTEAEKSNLLRQRYFAALAVANDTEEFDKKRIKHLEKVKTLLSQIIVSDENLYTKGEKAAKTAQEVLDKHLRTGDPGTEAYKQRTAELEIKAAEAWAKLDATTIFSKDQLRGFVGNINTIYMSIMKDEIALQSDRQKYLLERKKLIHKEAFIVAGRLEANGLMARAQQFFDLAKQTNPNIVRDMAPLRQGGLLEQVGGQGTESRLDDIGVMSTGIDIAKARMKILQEELKWARINLTDLLASSKEIETTGITANEAVAKQKADQLANLRMLEDQSKNLMRTFMFEDEEPFEAIIQLLKDYTKAIGDVEKQKEIVQRMIGHKDEIKQVQSALSSGLAVATKLGETDFETAWSISPMVAIVNKMILATKWHEDNILATEEYMLLLDKIGENATKLVGLENKSKNVSDGIVEATNQLIKSQKSYGKSLNELNVNFGQAIFNLNSHIIKMGGTPPKTSALPATPKSLGGAIYANRGMFADRGTDTVAAMLTPGEFVVNAAATENMLGRLVPLNYGQHNVDNSSGDAMNFGDINVNVTAGPNDRITAGGIARELKLNLRHGMRC